MKTLIALCLLCTGLMVEARAQNWDFETGDLRNWTATGTAFNNQPTLGDNIAARSFGTRSGHHGNYWIGTYENRHTSGDPAGQVQGDEPQGELISSGFDITNRQLSFLIGGGNDFNRLRVELLLRIRPGEPLPPAILGLLGIGERVTLSDGQYFVGAHATGRNTESMRRETWDLGVYMGRRARLRIKDAASGGWGHINADDFQFGATPPPAGRIHVTSDIGGDVEGAEVFINGNRIGVTDARGNLRVAPLSTANDIVARKLVFENRSHRANHSTGSSQNWNWRVYNTSLRVNNDATFTALAVTNPAAIQEVQLSRRSSTIGLHLVVSMEWNASSGEIFGIRENEIIQASQFLYNATDGQFFIEQVELVDDSGQWDEADYRITANWSLTANADGDDFNAGNGRVHMARNNAASTYIHEFGHYGFDLRDEYLERPARCTNNVNRMECATGTVSPIVDFGTYQPKASCIMWLQGCTSKLCSNRPENPHARGTRQGDTPCWTRIAEKFRDRERDGGVVRWNLQTPETRGAIVGMLPNIPNGWAPRVTIDNRSRANLCQPFNVVVTGADDGRLLGDREVWNRTFYDQNILEGRTTTDDPTTPENEAGRITVTGVHVGDRLSAGGEPFIVPDCTRASLDRNPVNGSFNGLQLASFYASPSEGGSNSMNIFELLQTKQGDVVVLKSAPAPFDFKISFEPTATASQVLIRARANVELKEPTQIEFFHSGSAKPQRVPMQFDAATGTYTGIISQLPVATRANVQATATDKAGRSVIRNVGVSISSVPQKDETDLFSTDGHLSLTIPVGALPEGARVAIGPGFVAAPVSGDGVEVVNGFNVTSSAGKRLHKPAMLRFHLPFSIGKGAPSFPYDPSFEVLHYDLANARWEKAGGTFLDVVNIVTLPINELGEYVLTARRLTSPVQSQFKVIGLSLTASPSKHEGPCPATIKFDGSIETNGPGVVQYTFLRSDGAMAPAQTLAFKSAGKLAVSNTWSIGGGSLPSYTGWTVLKIYSPTSMESDRANFEVQCK